jgi:tetratricopeptide (TPR) repeat protein
MRHLQGVRFPSRAARRAARLCARGRVVQERGNYPAAASLYQQALAFAATSSDPSPLIHALTLLGNLRRLQGRYDQAEKLLTEAVQQADHPSIDPSTAADALNALGILQKDTGRYPSARRLYQRALTLTDPHDLSRRATLHHNLAGVAHAQGRYLDAEPDARTAVDLRRRLTGDHHPAVAADLAVLGAVLYGQQRYAEAQQLFQQALTTFTTCYGPTHYEVAVNLGNLAACHAATGALDLAEHGYQQALTLKTELLGESHPEIAASLNNLAFVLNRAGRHDQARALLKRAAAVHQAKLGPDHPTTRRIHNNLASLGADPVQAVGDKQQPDSQAGSSTEKAP